MTHRRAAQRVAAVKDTWSALPEVDALLAQLRHDEIGVRHAVRDMSVADLAAFRSQLHELSNTLYDTAVGIVRAGADPAPPLPRRMPVEEPPADQDEECVEELPEDDIRQAMAADLRRMGLM